MVDCKRESETQQVGSRPWKIWQSGMYDLLLSRANDCPAGRNPGPPPWPDPTESRLFLHVYGPPSPRFWKRMSLPCGGGSCHPRPADVSGTRACPGKRHAFPEEQGHEFQQPLTTVVCSPKPARAKIRLLIVDDHAILLRRPAILFFSPRQTCRWWARQIPGRKWSARPGWPLPDIVLLDLAMPGGGGLTVIKKIREASPHSRVLVLTMHEEFAYVRTVLASGASGYMVKTAPESGVLSALCAGPSAARPMSITTSPIPWCSRPWVRRGVLRRRPPTRTVP